MASWLIVLVGTAVLGSLLSWSVVTGQPGEQNLRTEIAQDWKLVVWIYLLFLFPASMAVLLKGYYPAAAIVAGTCILLGPAMFGLWALTGDGVGERSFKKLLIAWPVLVMSCVACGLVSLFTLGV